MTNRWKILLSKTVVPKTTYRLTSGIGYDAYEEWYRVYNSKAYNQGLNVEMKLFWSTVLNKLGVFKIDKPGLFDFYFSLINSRDTIRK